MRKDAVRLAAWRLLGVVLCAGPACGQLVDPQADPNDPAEDGGVLIAPTDPPGAEKPAEPAAEDPQVQAGRALFRRAAEAMQAAGAISYTAVTSAEGALLESSNPFTRSIVRGVRTPASTRAGVWLIRATGSGSQGKGKDVREFDAAWKRQSIEWVDHEADKVIESASGSRTGPAFQVAVAAKIDDMFQAVPFRDQVNAVSFTIEPRQTINGVECDVILLETSGRKRQRWAIGVADSLPRRVDRLIESPIVNGYMRLDLTDLAVFPKGSEPFSEEQIAVAVPEGYTQERPPPRPPASNQGSTTRALPGSGKGEVVPKDLSGAGETPEEKIETPAAPPPPAVEYAPSFELTTTAGETITLESIRGKVAVIDFYGSWCVPAPQWHQELQRLASEYAGREVVFVLAAVREKSETAAAEYVREHELTLPVSPLGDAAAQAFGARVYPCTVVVDPAGQLVTRIQGARAGSSLEGLRDAIGEGLGEVVEKE